MTPKQQEKKIDNFDFIKTEKLCASKDTGKWNDNHSMEENTCKSHTQEEILSGTYKEHLQPKNKKKIHFFK